MRMGCLGQVRKEGEGVETVSAGRRRGPGIPKRGAVGAVAAVVVVVVAAAGLLMGQRGHDTATTPDPTGTPGEAATWPPGLNPGEGQWTGLEWHDITASAGGIFVDRAPWLEGSRMDEAVAWRDGFALVGGDGNLWTSKDGLTWAHATGAPQY